MNIRWGLLPILTMAAGVFLGSCIFSTFSLPIACIVKTRERFMGIGQVLTMPLFFASNAIYPLAYLVDALRGAMIVGGKGVYSGGMSFGVMTIVFVALLAMASRLYPGPAR